MVSVGNASDGDKPLALLYRRFTRQFGLAEKFFSGDNPRPEVVEHHRIHGKLSNIFCELHKMRMRTPRKRTEEMMTIIARKSGRCTGLCKWKHHPICCGIWWKPTRRTWRPKMNKADYRCIMRQRASHQPIPIVTCPPRPFTASTSLTNYSTSTQKRLRNQMRMVSTTDGGRACG